MRYMMVDSVTCLELALEGERLCKAGDCRAGVAFFEAAIQSGTDDLRTLSAIYSQLGNAYFFLGDYIKAMQYHKHDLTLARTMGDRLGEAKASGNLGNTLKVMGRFDEAAVCCKRHLDISKELGDKIGEGRALYNLGNVYHAKGKHIGRLGQQDPGEFPEEVRLCLQTAIGYYEQNLSLMRELQDRAAQGRACGNLGNTHYLLGNFSQAICYHQERLTIAKEFGDKPAERRAHSNLGNAHIFLGEFEVAASHYQRTLQLAQEIGDRAVEAQACYSLGNTFTLLRDYRAAIEYHLKHLRIAQELLDKVGEGRACWSLGNAHTALGDHYTALKYAERHLEISKEIGDQVGQTTAQMNLNDLKQAINCPTSTLSTICLSNESGTDDKNGIRTDHVFSKRVSMECMDLIKMTPDAKTSQARRKKQQGTENVDPSLLPHEATRSPLNESTVNEDDEGSCAAEDDSFFEHLSRFQSKRMDDQRCELGGTKGQNWYSCENNKEKEEFLDFIEGMQNRRMEEQRADPPSFPGLNGPRKTAILRRLNDHNSQVQSPDDKFFEMLARCQSARLEDQRSDMPPSSHQRALTVPDEDFFSLIMRLQSRRLEDQRASPTTLKRN
ncbi:G-protein-signaling modulator 2-like isoform X2 [Artemia franciscana]|uniref:G-protein-signaling modulator 2-like isoform X2 n=2 Tax=Artemia franciscana TaxID=6661 RepID=UPI0032DA379E